MPRFVDYGKIFETRVKGNKSCTTESKFCEGEEIFPRRERVEERIFVKNQKEEHEEYLKFSDELARDKGMLDPVWRIEHRNRKDGYYVIKCYSRLLPER